MITVSVCFACTYAALHLQCDAGGDAQGSAFMATHVAVRPLGPYSERARASGRIGIMRRWFVLLALTGIEVLLGYLQAPTLIMLTALLGLSIVKAALIIAYFMHLKFEKLSLFLTLFPMLIFCIILMLIFLCDAVRIPLMRPGI